MPTDREERRLRIFREYSANLALVRPEYQGQFVCPLCLAGGFTEDAVLGPRPRLTEEHCIPRGLGRNLYTLTCESCNNTAGKVLDHHFHKRLSFEAFWAGTLGASITAKIEVYGRKLAVLATRQAGTPPKIEFRVLGENCNPQDIEHVQKLMQEGRLFQEMQMQIGTRYVPSIKRFRIAVLKTGYLLMFRHFGYEYILNPALNDVRFQISNVRLSVVPLGAVILRVPIESLPPAIGHVTAPDDLGGLAVPIPVPKYGVGLVVALPSDRETYTRWSQMQTRIGDDTTVKLTYRALPFDRSLLTDRPFKWNAMARDEQKSTDAAAVASGQSPSR